MNNANVLRFSPKKRSNMNLVCLIFYEEGDMGNYVILSDEKEMAYKLVLLTYIKMRGSGLFFRSYLLIIDI